jgi:hypothetical protein
MHSIVEVTMMAARSSNHKPLPVNYSMKIVRGGRQKKGFKFEDSWTTDEKYSEQIKLAWSRMATGATPLLSAQQNWKIVKKCYQGGVQKKNWEVRNHSQGENKIIGKAAEI